MTLRISDPSGGSDTAPMTINITGSLDSPVIVGPKEIEYPENGTWQVASYEATNSLGPTGGWIISVQPGGGDGDYFDIDDEGVLTFTQPPDYESPADEDDNNIYSFSITAYENNPPRGQRPRQTFYSVKVIVTPEDDLPEIDGPSSVNHRENSREVATYTVSGADSGETITWKALSGADSGKLSLTNGVLAFDSPPDFEAPASAAGDNVYLVTLMVEAGSQMKTEHVRVTVTNVNEAPTFPAETATRSVGENAGPNEPIGDPITATDPDKNDSLTYDLTGTDDDTSFEIDQYTGQLKTKTGEDYGSKDSYTVTVTATDQGDLTDTITVTITTNEENDAPVFDDANLDTDLEVPENSPANANVGDPITATDEDSNSLTYTLEGDGKDSFTIDSAGQIKTKTGAIYDYEAQNRYEVTVKADDSNGGTDTIDVTITLTNVDEAGAVTFDSTPPKAGTFLVATVTDPDGNPSVDTWEWLISDSANTGFTAIANQTSNNYTRQPPTWASTLKARRPTPTMKAPARARSRPRLTRWRRVIRLPRLTMGPTQPLRGRKHRVRPEHRHPGGCHRRRRRYVELHLGRNGCHVLYHRRNFRPVAD